jgi:alkylated DNA repair dioxygenase AlkB
MSTHLQTSLLDVAPVGGPSLGLLTDGLTRTPLSAGAWIDLRPGWVSGSDELFERLVTVVPWHADRRTMYDRVVDVPRLLSWFGEDAELPDPLLLQARQALDRHYRDELGEPFRTAGLCYYRDGRDSVAWHGDTIGRSRYQDTMVAIVSLGAARKLMLRPRSGGPSMGFP